ncbi:hypothetical protein [Rhodoferax sp. PAMC 29310]|uniref:hypothetical protein n=1 Tax=Rhodoferax sp. PAMC 29310 TaxID=2822760 RepID=UPI001B33AF21|nr:hypothetical protein [Rhodoferax sp. PAMC 29310]
MRASHSTRTLLLVVTAVLGGCASVPVAELASYRDAFREVSVVGTTLYAQAGKTVVDVQAAQTGKQHSLDLVNPPSEFDPRAVAGPTGPDADFPPAIALRLAALQTVVAYNDSLVAHVSGDPLEKITAPLKAAAGSMNRFIDLARNFTGKRVKGSVETDLPAINPFNLIATSGVLGGLKGLVTIALQAKANNEMRQALLDAYEPIQQVLSILEADTAQLYGFQKVQCALVRNGEALPMINVTLDSVDGFTAAFARPTQGGLREEVNALEQRMTASFVAVYQPDVPFDPCGSGKAKSMISSDLSDALNGFPYRFPFAEQRGMPLTEKGALLLGGFVNEVEQQALRTVAARETLRSYHARMLPDYVVLLRDAKQGLSVVWAAATRIPSLAGHGGELTTIGTNIRDSIIRIRSAMKADASTQSP